MLNGTLNDEENEFAETVQVGSGQLPQQKAPCLAILHNQAQSVPVKFLTCGIQRFSQAAYPAFFASR
jgi:hypothetical protein